MKKVFEPHHRRIWEAIPPLVEPSGYAAEDAQGLFGPICQIGPPPKAKYRDELHFCHAADVQDLEAQAVLKGIRKIMQEVGSKIRILNGQHGNSDWYQREALIDRDMGFGRQVSIARAHELLSKEPYQKNHHMNVVLFDHDMTSGESDNNFIYGAANYPHYVMSVKRFRNLIKDNSLRQAALAVVAAHEMGHNFGLVGRNFNRINKLGSHCNGEQKPCLMEQVDVDGCRTLESQTRLIADNIRWLCEDCLEEADFKKKGLEARGILW